MYLRFYRFFPSFKPDSDSDSDDINISSPSTLSPSSPSVPDFNLSSPTRTRFSFLSHFQSKQQQQQKTVHWGPTTEIPPIKPEPEAHLHPLRANPVLQSQFQPQPQPQPKRAHSHVHVYVKPIRKPPTPLDQEMLHRNLWEMIYQAEAKIELNYECQNLSGEGENDDRVLDAWFRVEEQAMHKGVNRAARAQIKAQVQAQARPKIAKRRKRAKRGRACLARGVLESEAVETVVKD